jgi:rubrerythrin
MSTKDLGDILGLAITKEQEAFDFYMDLTKIAADKQAKDALEYIAGEEKKHKEFLIGYRDKGAGDAGLKPGTTVDYKIAEHLEAPEPKAGMEQKDVYLIAAHREKSAHEFYLSLAEVHPEGDAKNVLLKMADEELKHKEKMEYFYTNAAFAQTDGG